VQARLLFSLVTIALVVSAGRAFCQTSSPAIFAGAEKRDENPDGLAALVELFQGYDDNVTASESGGSPERPPQADTVGGMYSGLNVGVQYLALGDGGQFRSWVNSAVRYYPDLQGVTASYHQVGATLSRSLSRRTSVYVSPFAAYSPLYSMQLIPESGADVDGLVVEAPVSSGGPDFDFAVLRSESIRYGGNTGMNFTLSPAARLSLSYGYGKTQFDDRPLDLEVQTASINYGHRLTKNASLKLGYSRHEGTGYVTGRQLVESANFGVDYRKPLSRSRRTVLRFSTGSSFAESTAGRRMEATGSASLAHQIGRTWTAQLDYRRGYRHLDGFERPVFSDSANASLRGLLTRRLEFSTLTSYFTGAVGLRPNSPRFESYLASGRLRTALSRTLAAYVEYRYYHYRFDDSVVRPFGVPDTFGRRGARIGLSMFLPLIG
jgi:hypothetical protein